MSQAFKDTLKGGWQPQKNKSQSFSVRGNVKGANTVAKRLGHGKAPEYTDMRDHSSTPLSTLKDPSSFGPPPKHIAAHGPEAANASARAGGQTGSALTGPSWAHIPGETSSKPTQSPSPQSQPDLKSPPIPSRQGLSSGSGTSSPVPAASSSMAAPKLPPRLPPRQNTQDGEPPPPPYEASANEQATEQTGYINQAAAGRLGKSGISVPGLGIGGASKSPPPTGRQPAAPKSSGQMNELSSRFSKMGRTSSNDTAASAPASGTSWAQKQSALKTADSFRRDPSSVSMSDARGAASTANNFRQRHGEQVAAGVNAANGLNQKYGGQGAPTPPSGQEVETEVEDEEEEQRRAAHANDGDVAAAVAAKKKPPPPPKKSALSAPSTGGQQIMSGAASPPPVPMSSKPR